MTTPNDNAQNNREAFGIAIGKWQAAHARLHRSNTRLKQAQEDNRAAGKEIHQAREELAKIGNKLIGDRWWEQVDELKDVDTSWVSLSKRVANYEDDTL